MTKILFGKIPSFLLNKDEHCSWDSYPCFLLNYGDSYADGCGYGSGDACGDSYEDGSGYGHGYGDEDGHGSGYGDTCGNSHADGSGYGDDCSYYGYAPQDIVKS